MNPRYIRQLPEIGIVHIFRCSRPENLPEFDISDWEFGEAVQVIDVLVEVVESRFAKVQHFKCYICLPQVMFYCWEIEPTERLTFTNLLQHLDSLVASEYEETG